MFDFLAVVFDYRRSLGSPSCADTFFDLQSAFLTCSQHASLGEQAFACSASIFLLLRQKKEPKKRRPLSRSKARWKIAALRRKRNSLAANVSKLKQPFS